MMMRRPSRRILVMMTMMMTMITTTMAAAVAPRVRVHRARIGQAFLRSLSAETEVRCPADSAGHLIFIPLHLRFLLKIRDQNHEFRARPYLCPLLLVTHTEEQIEGGDSDDKGKTA